MKSSSSWRMELLLVGMADGDAVTAAWGAGALHDHWEIGTPGDFERPRSSAEIIQKLEERVGPEGRKIFECFLKQVSRLQEKQRLAIMGEEAEEAEVIEDEADAESDIGS
jgi:hypothetical protein